MDFKTFTIPIILVIIAVAGCTEEDAGPSENITKNTEIRNEGMSPGGPEQPLEYEASGLCYHVVDGDTIDVEGVGRIRLVGVNTPERGQPGYQEAKDFLEQMCLGKIVYLDIDDEKPRDKYGRILAVIYIDSLNLNAELLRRGYAKILYIPPSEFDPYSWT